MNSDVLCVCETKGKIVADFLSYEERLRSLVRDTQVMRGPEGGSEHLLVISKTALAKRGTTEKKGNARI